MPMASSTCRYQGSQSPGRTGQSTAFCPSAEAIGPKTGWQPITEAGLSSMASTGACFTEVKSLSNWSAT